MNNNMKKKEKKINPVLANLLSCIGVKFGKSNLEFSDNYAKVFGIIKYPQQVQEGFLSRIINIQNTYSSITYQPIDNMSLIDSLNKNITNQYRKASSAKLASEIKNAEISMRNSDELMEHLTSENVSVGLLSTTIMPYSNDKEEFIKLCRRTQAKIAGERCVSRVISNLQREAFENITPYHAGNKQILNITNKVMPLETFIGGFPFATTGLNDGDGYFLAKDSNGSLIIFDMWKRGADRGNSNILITGKPGTGKSATTKHIILNEFANGTKILVLDPEREYKEMAIKLKGNWLNCAGGKNRINPFEIRQMPHEDDEEDGLNDLARHLNFLEGFFKLYNNNLSIDAWNTLKQYILEMYKNKGITFETDTSSINSSDYPTFTDLFELINKKEKNEINLTLLLSLQDITEGGDSFIWNGTTQIDTSSNIVVFDTKDLQDASDNKKATQYYNLVTYCWNLIEKDRNQRVMLICDEAYLMIDQKVPQTLIFLRNASKRIRKYEGSLCVITQDTQDFLSPAIKQYGQALLTNPSYVLLFGTDTENLKEEKSLWNLTEKEVTLLEEKRRGHAIFIAGNKRIHANFLISEEEFKFMGNSGGR